MSTWIGPTNNIYGHKYRCGCRDCQDVRNRYASMRAKLVRQGRGIELVDVEPVKDHLDMLTGLGALASTIQRRIGDYDLSQMMGTIHNRPSPKRMKKKYADAILALTPRDVSVPDPKHDRMSDYVLAKGSARRLQGLSLYGWTPKLISQYSGIPTATLGWIKSERSVNIQVDHFLRLREATSIMLAKPAPVTQAAKRTQNHAAKMGYVNLFDWNDIDDPVDEPTATQTPKGEELVDEMFLNALVEGVTTYDPKRDGQLNDSEKFRLAELVVHAEPQFVQYERTDSEDLRLRQVTPDERYSSILGVTRSVGYKWVRRVDGYVKTRQPAQPIKREERKCVTCGEVKNTGAFIDSLRWHTDLTSCKACRSAKLI